jgi:hypothetical protein
MRNRRLACTLLPALALLVTGCAAGGPDPRAVAWTDDVCGALTGFTLAVTREPVVDGSDAAAAVRGLSGYIASASDALQQSIGALGEVGPSPVAGGDEYVARLREALSHIRTSFDAAGSQLATVDTTNRAELATALPAAMAPLQELRNMPSPAEGLTATDDLSAASAEAPNCQAMRTASTTKS